MATITTASASFTSRSGPSSAPRFRQYRGPHWAEATRISATRACACTFAVSRGSRTAPSSYRVVASDAEDVTYGLDETFTVPDGTTPEVFTGPATRIADGTAKVGDA